MSNQNKHALVLSGGGFNGAFQLGALNCLNTHWKEITGLDTPMHFDIIAGVSVGSLNGSLLAMDKLNELNKLWDDVAKNGVKEIFTSDFINTESEENHIDFDINFKKIKKRLFPKFEFEFSFFDIFRSQETLINKNLKKLFKEIEKSLPNFKSIASNKPLEDKLIRLLDKDKVTTNFLCGFVSLNDGLYHSISSQEFTTNTDFVKGVLASTSIPVVWNPVPEIKLKTKSIKNSVDGGIRNVSPLGDVIKQIKKTSDEYTIFIINCSSGEIFPTDYSNANIGSIALRSLNDIAITEIFNNDVNHFLEINELVQQFNKQTHSVSGDLELKGNKKFKDFKSVVIQPDILEDPEKWDSLVANQQVIPFRINHGDEKAQSAIKKLKNNPDFNRTAEII